MKEYVFHPKGTCSREMHIYYEDGIIKKFEVIGGCRGNLKGIAALIQDRKISDIIPLIEGIKCGTKSTSCPDQLSIALKEIEAIENKSI